MEKGQVIKGYGLHMSEGYSKAKGVCQQAATIGQCADNGTLAAWGIAIALRGLGDYEASGENLSVAFKVLTVIKGTIEEIAGLPVVAIVYDYQGQPGRTVELLTLVIKHLVEASGWREKWPLPKRLQADLGMPLGSEAYSVALERGKQLDLDSVIGELKVQLFNADPSIPKPANQAYSDPLSPRELEVLTFIADGLTNREIADRLFVSFSTVKKHIQHIYAKLNTKNRTSAIVRARELKLIS
jgi:DNA-binding CsgD family transcriptional regulator